MSAIYSPTQTQVWLTDPLAWYLRYREGWSPRVLGKPDLARIVGAGVADGAAVWYRTGNRVGAAQTAHKAAVGELSDLLKAGHTVAPAQEGFSQRVGTLAEAGVTKLSNFDLPSTWKIVDVERTLPDHGRCRIDLGVQTPHGPGVWDVKCAMTYDEYRAFQAKQEHEASWQLLHYAWGYGDVIGEPVTQYGVIYVPLEPKSRKPELFTYTADPELLGLWLQSARRVWEDMEWEEMPDTLSGRVVTLYSSFHFFGRYGKEAHADAILRYKLDPSLMTQGYVQHRKGA